MGQVTGVGDFTRKKFQTSSHATFRPRQISETENVSRNVSTGYARSCNYFEQSETSRGLSKVTFLEQMLIINVHDF